MDPADSNFASLIFSELINMEKNIFSLGARKIKKHRRLGPNIRPLLIKQNSMFDLFSSYELIKIYATCSQKFSLKFERDLLFYKKICCRTKLQIHDSTEFMQEAV